MRASSATALAAIAVAATGCGGSGDKGSDSQQVTRAVTDYAHAFGNGDGKRACSLLSGGARKAFVQRVSSLVGTSDCTEAVGKLQAEAGAAVTGPFQTATVRAVRVSGDHATARVVAGGHAETVTLEKTKAGWLLTKAPGS